MCIFFISECFRKLNQNSSYHKTQKLSATFNTRTNYVTHYMNLKTYLELGMVLTKIHKVFRFRQSTFLKKYIDFCTELRKNSKTRFDSLCFKLMVNSVFGKWLERTRDYLTCHFATTSAKLSKHILSPRFSNFKIINDNLVIVFQSTARCRLNKLYTIGFTVLERSKDFMYRQYYNEIKPRLGDVEVLFSDTDSFCLQVKNNAVTDNLAKLKGIMDYSNYPSEHPNFSHKQKNQLGLFKDELKGGKILDYVGIRSKTYSLKIQPYLGGGKKLKQKKTSFILSTAKGVRTGYKKPIPFNDFKKCIKTISRVNVTQFHITSKQHVLATTKVRKTAWTSFDDKRWLFHCGVHSTPYGSSQISAKCPYCK